MDTDASKNCDLQTNEVVVTRWGKPVRISSCILRNWRHILSGCSIKDVYRFIRHYHHPEICPRPDIFDCCPSELNLVVNVGGFRFFIPKPVVQRLHYFKGLIDFASSSSTLDTADTLPFIDWDPHRFEGFLDFILNREAGLEEEHDAIWQDETLFFQLDKRIPQSSSFSDYIIQKDSLIQWSDCEIQSIETSSCTFRFLHILCQVKENMFCWPFDTGSCCCISVVDQQENIHKYSLCFSSSTSLPSQLCLHETRELIFSVSTPCTFSCLPCELDDFIVFFFSSTVSEPQPTSVRVLDTHGHVSWFSTFLLSLSCMFPGMATTGTELYIIDTSVVRPVLVEINFDIDVKPITKLIVYHLPRLFFENSVARTE